MDSQGSDRIAHLDGLRGLCALIVVFHHFAAAFYPATVLGSKSAAHHLFELTIFGSPLNLFIGGNFAVTIFFVLSGFVLSYAFFKQQSFLGLQRLAIRRYFRLTLPLLGSVMIGYFLHSSHLFFHDLIVPITFSSLWFGTFFQFIPHFSEALYQGLIGIYTSKDASYYNPVIWSMYFELWGSFLVFGFLALFGTFKKRYFGYLFLFLIFWDSYFLGFLLGMVGADLYHSGVGRHLFQQKVFISTLFFTGLLLGSYPSNYADETIYQFFTFVDEDTSTLFYHTVGAFCLLMTVVHSKKLSGVFSHSVFRFLGKISFSLYLLHKVILLSFSSLLFYILYLFLPYDFAVLLTVLGSLPLMLLCADLYYFWVDKKSIRFAKSFSDNHL